MIALEPLVNETAGVTGSCVAFTHTLIIVFFLVAVSLNLGGNFGFGRKFSGRKCCKVNYYKRKIFKDTTGGNFEEDFGFRDREEIFGAEEKNYRAQITRQYALSLYRSPGFILHGLRVHNFARRNMSFDYHSFLKMKYIQYNSKAVCVLLIRSVSQRKDRRTNSSHYCLGTCFKMTIFGLSSQFFVQSHRIFFRLFFVPTDHGEQRHLVVVRTEVV